MNAPMPLKPLIQHAALAKRHGRNELRCSHGAGRQCRYKWRDGIANIRRYQNDEPICICVIPQPRGKHYSQAERHEGIAKEICNLHGQADAGPRCSSPSRQASQPPAIKCSEPGLDLLIGLDEELTRLPIRHQHQGYGEPVTDKRDIEWRKEKCGGPSRGYHSYSHDRESGCTCLPASRERTNPACYCKSDGKPHLYPFSSPHVYMTLLL